MIKKFAIGAVGLIAAVVAVVLVLATTKPDTFRVQRAASLKALAEA